MSTAPARRRVELPVDGLMPRVGKIRLGTTTEYERDGETRYRPVKADHFVVVEDESGITSAEAAAAFAAVYGAEPTEIHAALPGVTPDDVMEGAWRSYGTRKLKIKCDGETCDIRQDTGGWLEGQPCDCTTKKIPVESQKHCTLTYTIQLLLPDVAGVGVWQLDTGSEISARRMATWLRMMETLRGDLRMLEFDLRLVPVAVTPEGKATTVYVLDPQARESTPRQMLEGAGSHRLAALPAPAADETPEPTLDRGSFEDSPAAGAAAAATSAASPQAGGGPPGQPAAGEHDLATEQLDIVRTNVEAQLRFLDPALKERLKAICDHYQVRPTRDGLIHAWGSKAQDLRVLVDGVERLINEEAQLAIPADDDSELVDAEIVN